MFKQNITEKKSVFPKYCFKEVGVSSQEFNSSGLGKATLRGVRRCVHCGTFNGTRGSSCKNKKCSTIFKAKPSTQPSTFNLDGLGRATRRGIKRCPSCGTINGTKSSHCKNKSCHTALKTLANKKKVLSDTCRLDTGTSTRVYSVRVRDKGPDQRGFVQLPVLQSPLVDSNDLLHSTALCFVDLCQGNFKTNVLQCHEIKADQRAVVCAHINSALNCGDDALPLTVNTTVLEAISIDTQLKEDLWALLMGSSGPAVQRVSRDVFAVKCRVSSKFPLGFLHATFFAGRSDNELEFSCPCSAFKESGRTGSSDGRCPHFYACICAFVNQDCLRKEFAGYIRLEVSLRFSSPVEEGEREESSDIAKILDCHVEILQDSMSAILSDVVSADAAILTDSLQTDGCVLTGNDPNSCSVAAILSETASDGNSIGHCQDHESSILTGTVDAGGHCVLSESLSQDAIVFSTKMELSREDIAPLVLPNQHLENLAFDLQGDTFVHDLTGLHHLLPINLEPAENNIEKQLNKSRWPRSRPQLSFVEWLGTVTESINQHMHYQFTGRPSPLVFHTPRKFFEKLKERMYRSRRKRLASSVTVFTRNDSVPVGTFVKHSWTLASRYHVKAVFDTPQIPLHLERSFVQKTDGTYEPTDKLDVLEILDIEPIPLFRTYLRVGMCKGETEAVPFKVEWIPDVLPVSQIGELRVEFEFGHEPGLLVGAR